MVPWIFTAKVIYWSSGLAIPVITAVARARRGRGVVSGAGVGTAGGAVVSRHYLGYHATLALGAVPIWISGAILARSLRSLPRYWLTWRAAVALANRSLEGRSQG